MYVVGPFSLFNIAATFKKKLIMGQGTRLVSIEQHYTKNRMTM